MKAIISTTLEKNNTFTISTIYKEDESITEKQVIELFVIICTVVKEGCSNILFRDTNQITYTNEDSIVRNYQIIDF